MKKACHTGAAYLCESWTKEKDWWLRKKQYYCFKCGRPIELNSKTNHWKHTARESCPPVFERRM
jgi:hypothetical protein